MVVLGSEWPRNCWMTSRGASFTAMLVPTVWRMEGGEMAFVMPAARTYFFTMFWTERGGGEGAVGVFAPLAGAPHQPPPPPPSAEPPPPPPDAPPPPKPTTRHN